MPRRWEEGTPPQDSPEQVHEQDAPAQNGVRNDANGVAPGAPPIVEKLLAAGNIDPRDVAHIALGVEIGDEVVPTAEGITFFKGERARRHKESGASKSLLEERLDRIKKGGA